MLIPIWDTDIVYGESFTMHREKNGEASAPFLYEPEKIIEVRSADLQTLYEQGKDYLIKEGEIVLTENTSIPFMEYEDIYMKEELPGRSFPYPGGHLLFSEGHFFHDRQIAVTYQCKKGGWKGYIPTYKGDVLHRTVRKLTEDKELKVVLLGDSISAGANASGMMLANPYQPRFIELFAEKLRRTYGANVVLHNSAVGGKDSLWGLEVLNESVIAHAPDLVILAFGMNGGHKPEVFASHIRNMIERIKAANADTDIILIATSTPNSILTDEKAKFWNYQHLYGETLKKFETNGIALLDMGAVQKELHKNKRFIDTTGNNVNHPNDFFIRIHAQALSQMLVK
jgi:lysophospholipase L1-like esterase